jgi:hypothetical protein
MNLVVGLVRLVVDGRHVAAAANVSAAGGSVHACPLCLWLGDARLR